MDQLCDTHGIVVDCISQITLSPSAVRLILQQTMLERPIAETKLILLHGPRVNPNGHEERGLEHYLLSGLVQRCQFESMGHCKGSRGSSRVT